MSARVRTGHLQQDRGDPPARQDVSIYRRPLHIRFRAVACDIGHKTPCSPKTAITAHTHHKLISVLWNQAFGCESLLAEPSTQGMRANHLGKQSGHFHSGWPPAVIAGAFQTGVLGVRALRRRGVAALCFDCNPSYPGFRSTYGPARLCPDPDLEPASWLQFMLDLGREFGSRPALIPSSDQFVTAIAQHARALKEYFVLSHGIELQAQLADKKSQYELAAAHGMPMPRTQYATSIDEVVEFAAAATFPCLIKPMHFREWRRLPPRHPLLNEKIAIADTPAALVAHYHHVRATTPDVVLQEIIQGPDTAKRVYLSCYSAAGVRIANAMFRELRCAPVGFGPATVSEPVVDAHTDAICDRFLRSIGYVGVCEIEMKWDSRDGNVKLIEVNPRLSGGGDAAPYAGVDLCWLHYLDLIGSTPAPVGPRGNDFRHIVLRADGTAVPAYFRAGLLGWRALLRSYRPPVVFYDLDWRDWRYSLVSILIFLRSLLRGTVNNLYRRKDPTP